MFEERMFTIAFQILQIFLFIFVRFFLHAARKRHRLFVTIKKRQGEANRLFSSAIFLLS